MKTKTKIVLSIIAIGFITYNHMWFYYFFKDPARFVHIVWTHEEVVADAYIICPNIENKYDQMDCWREHRWHTPYGFEYKKCLKDAPEGTDCTNYDEAYYDWPKHRLQECFEIPYEEAMLSFECFRDVGLNAPTTEQFLSCLNNHPRKDCEDVGYEFYAKK